MKKIVSLMILLVIAMLSFATGTYKVQPPGNEIVVTLNADLNDSFEALTMTTVDNEFNVDADAVKTYSQMDVDVSPGNVVQEVALQIQTYTYSYCNYPINLQLENNLINTLVVDFIHQSIFVKYRNNSF